MIQGTFAGRLGRDADLRQTPAGKSVCNFSVAVDKRNGQDKVTMWIDAAIWEKRAEALAQYLTKGTPVVISGEIGIRQYQAKDGTEKAALTCNVREITLMGSGTREEQPNLAAERADMREREQRQAQAEGLARGRESAPAAAAGDFNDDIPF